MKIFVLGSSGTGKTPCAAQLSSRLSVPHVRASEWVRRLFREQGSASREAHIEAMTRFATEMLAQDPDSCLRFLKNEPALHGSCVIEGVRNPRDFVSLFDPRHDVAVFLEKTNHVIAPTAFENGLSVIRSYVQWSIDNRLSPSKALMEHRFDHFYRNEGSPSLDDAIDKTVTALRSIVGKPMSAMSARVHAEIAPMTLSVRKELLYGGDARYVGQRVPCRAFVVSSYAGSSPTFKILLDDGAVFSYVPPSALFHTDPTPPELGLADLVYANCPGGDFCVHHYQMLQGPVMAYFKHRDLWMNGLYRFSLDWYEGNDLLHLIALENGQHAFLPHHKLKFGGHPHGFEPYKKLRAEWKVPTGA